MPTKIDEAYIDLILKDKKFKQGMKDANKQMTGMKDQAKLVSTAIKGFFAFQGIRMGIGFLKSSVDALRVQIKAEQKLAGVLRATGHAAGFTAKELKAHASALQDVTTFGDEAIINTQALLATFRNIKGSTFERATELILDMSAAMGTDAKSSAILFGKALNDPVKGLSQLTRVGVTFSDEQKTLIKNFAAINDIAAAQAVILEELANQFGGVAEAMAQGELGKLDQMANTWGDLKEELAGLALEAGKASGALDALMRGVKRSKEDMRIISEGDFFAESPGRKLEERNRQLHQKIVLPYLAEQQRAQAAGAAVPTSQDLVRRMWAGLTGRGALSSGAMRDIKNKMAPGPAVFKDRGALTEGEAFSGAAGRFIGQAMGAFNALADTATDAQRAVALRKKIDALEPTRADTSKFFGLSGFGKALQESIGKPDEQKKRDDKRDAILDKAVTGIGKVADEVGKIVGRFAEGKPT